MRRETAHFREQLQGGAALEAYNQVYLDYLYPRMFLVSFSFHCPPVEKKKNAQTIVIRSLVAPNTVQLQTKSTALSPGCVNAVTTRGRRQSSKYNVLVPKIQFSNILILPHICAHLCCNLGYIDILMNLLRILRRYSLYEQIIS